MKFKVGDKVKIKSFKKIKKCLSEKIVVAFLLSAILL